MATDWMAAMSGSLSGGMTGMPPFVQAWMAPQGVKISGDDLVWSVTRSVKQRGVIRPDSGLLEQFVRLDSAPAEEIAEFARDFGVLGLCRHSSPWQWEHDDGTEERGRYCKPSGREPLAAWRELALFFRTVLRSAEDIDAGRRLDQERYAILNWFSPGYVSFDLDQDDRYWFTHGLNWFLRKAVTVGVGYGSARTGRPRMHFSGKSVIDALALQLGMAVCRTESAAVCDGCSRVYPRSRPTRPGQRNFCPDCRQAGAPQKFANRDRRSRQREKPEPE